MKSRRVKTEFFIIVLMIFGTILLCGKIMKDKQLEKKHIRDLLVQYNTAVTDKNYEKMYKMIVLDENDLREKDDFISRNQKIFEGIHTREVKLTNINVKKKDKNTYKVDYHCEYKTIAGTIHFDQKATFKERDDDFKLVWNDSLIFPELKKEYRIKIKHLKADRGKIYDRNGELLAGDGLAASVGIVPGKLEDKDVTLQTLSTLLEMDVNVIQNKLDEKWVTDTSFVPLSTIGDVEEKEVAELQSKLLQLPGVMISQVETRYYPGKEATAHLIGYVQNIDAEELAKYENQGYNTNSVIGKSGMEATYEKEIHAQDGYEILIEDPSGKTVKSLAKIKKKDGKDIYLSIDLDLQWMLYNEFKDDTGCSVALHPYTGEILALVSTPSYDTNEFVRGISNSSWNALNTNADKPMFNRYKQNWVPGSTFKPIVAGIGLSTDTLDPYKEYTYEGNSWQKNTTWGEYRITTLHSAAPISLERALILSDNIYFGQAALDIGQENMEKNLDKLGFNKDIPVDLALYKSQYSNTEHLESEIQLADTGYGQGQLLVNPIHLAALYTAFTNKGDVLKPTLEYSGKADSEIWIEDAFTAEAVMTINEGLVGVVSYGTGKAAKNSRYTLAGKTGTAELKNYKEEKNAKEIGWFASFTIDRSLEKPILLLSMVENVKELGGSKYVVEKDNAILSAYIR